MLINLRVVLLMVVSTTVVLCQSVVTKYYHDDNRIIKRLHASAHAKSFLRGCDVEPYIHLTANTTTESPIYKLLKSKQYLFAVYTLEEVSLILSQTSLSEGNQHESKTYDEEGGEEAGGGGEEEEEEEEEEHVAEYFVLFNITLGINKNSMAMLEVFYNKILIGNITETIVPILPTIPYYVNVSITHDSISVYEARTGASDPFLYFNFSSNLNFSCNLNFSSDLNFTSNFNISSNFNLEIQDYNVTFRHSSPIYAYYDCCEACSPWIFTRISGCLKYSARTSSTESETTYPLINDNSLNRSDNFLFTDNILVHHDGSPAFGAKIIFSEFSSLRGNRYEIGLSNTPTILHYYNSTAQNIKTLNGTTLKREYTSPFIVNITITKDGLVTLRQPYEDNPFLIYYAPIQQSKLNPVDVKYMSMVKFHEDFIRYDFFYNCTDVQSYADRHELNVTHLEKVSPAEVTKDNDTASYTRIWKYISKRFNTTKYDVLHIFRDSYQIYEKTIQVSENSSDYEDKISTNTTMGKCTVEPKTKESSSSSEWFKKTVVGVASFMFIGILKIICSLECVKNMMKGGDVDDDKAKDIRKSVGKLVGKNVADTFGFGE